MFGTPSMQTPHMGGAASRAVAAPDIEGLSQEAIGFQAIDGESKLHLLPSPWPADALPSPTSSLLSIASRAGLLAAAGPDCLVIGSTSSIRGSFFTKAPDGGSVKPYAPQLTFPVPRLSQVAFSSDEQHLVLCAADGGGLAVYDVQSLQQGSTQSSFQIATNGIGVRTLIPNPAEGSAHYFAIVLDDGKLMLADLQKQQFAHGISGVVLKEQVSCASWSNKGRQLTAGLGDGSASQLKPDGSVVGNIPKPPQLQAEFHISSLIWLLNESWLAVYSPSTPSDQAPESLFCFVSIDANTKQYTFQKLYDPCPPFGMNRQPPHHFLSRMRLFEPALVDSLFVASTCAGDVGLITCSSQPLSSDPAAAALVNKYVTMAYADDTRRAQLPIGDTSDTSPIGMAIDLSSRDPVKRPIPTDETIEQSQTPVPNLMILNNEGVLSSWNYIYNDSIRRGTIYSGLVAAPPSAKQQRPQSQQSATTFDSINQTPRLGGATFGSSMGQTTPTTPAFGSAGGGGGGGAAFGSAGLPGANKSVWGGTSQTGLSMQTGGATFGQPSFGSAGSLAGQRQPFGSDTRQAKPVFGQSTQNKPAQESPFGKFAGENKANDSGFGKFAGENKDTASPFGKFAGEKKGNQSPFGNVGKSTETSLFGKQSTSNESPFGKAAQQQETGWGFSHLGKDSKPATSLGQPQQSFGSTMTIGSSFGSVGAPSGLGSNQSPWQTPSLSNKPSDEASRQQQQERGHDMSMDPSEMFGKSMGGLQLGKGDGEQSKDKPKETPSRDDETPTPPPAPLPPSPKAATPKPKETPAEPPSPPDPRTLKSQQNKVDEPPFPLMPTGKASQLEESAPLPPSPKDKPEPQDENLPPAPASPSRQDSAPSPAGSSLQIVDREGGSRPASPAQTVDSDATATPDARHAPKSPVSSNRTQSAQVPPKPSWSAAATPQSKHPPAEKTPGNYQDTSPLSFVENASQEPTPSGSIKPPYMFQAPVPQQESPRSPSPQRPDSRSSSLRRQASRRSSTSPRRIMTDTPPAPPPAQSLFGEVRGPETNRFSFGAGLPSLKESSPDESRHQQPPSAQRQEVAHTHQSRSQQSQHQEPEPVQPKPRPSQEVPEFANAADSPNAVAELLAQPLPSARTLDNLLGSLDYLGGEKIRSIPGNIHHLYRDTQSVIDTLGLNARALGSFLKWHLDNYKDGGRTREDLANTSEEWALVEVQDLGVLIRGIERGLDEERVQDASDIIRELRKMQGVLYKLHSATSSIEKEVRQRKAESSGDALTSPDSDEPAAAEKSRGAVKLSPDQTQTLRTIRNDYTKIMGLLGKAEESSTLLRAKLASSSYSSAPRPSSLGASIRSSIGPRGSDSPRGGSPSLSASTIRSPSRTTMSTPPQVPTVQNIINTISKMSRMAETKLSDTTLLESRIAAAKAQGLLRSPRKSSYRNRGDRGSGEEGGDFGLSRLSLRGSESPELLRRSARGTARKGGVFEVPSESSAKSSPSRSRSERSLRTPVKHSQSAVDDDATEKGKTKAMTKEEAMKRLGIEGGDLKYFRDLKARKAKVAKGLRGVVAQTKEEMDDGNVKRESVDVGDGDEEVRGRDVSVKMEEY